MSCNLRGFHRPDADRSFREVGGQDLPFFTSEFRFCHGVSYFMLDFMEHNASLVPSPATACFGPLIDEIYIEGEDPIIGSSMGGSRRGAGHVLFLAGSNG